MEVGCRLVARDFKGNDQGRDDLFAATPPLEAKRMLLSRAATRKTVGHTGPRKANLNPRCMQGIFIELPEECGAGPSVCGKWNFWLYGFRPASAAWEELYSCKLVECGFETGLTCAGVFYHAERDISCVVHGDDFAFEGGGPELLWLTEKMKSWFDKSEGIVGARRWRRQACSYSWEACEVDC